MSSAEDMSALGDELVRLADGPSLPAHVYVHVPFCREKCGYCDFSSYSGVAGDTVHAVYTGLEAEVRRWASSGLPGVVETVYVGGGTPTLHAARTASVLQCIARDLPLAEDAEITVEGNPDSLGREELDAIVDGGATRISIGVQSFDDSVLRLLGRCHDSRQAFEACGLVVDRGLSLSVDLICGVPGQSMASWESSLDRAVSTGAGHVSVYPLSIEEGTPMGVAVDSGLLDEPDPDLAAEMLERAEDMLSEAGLARYEVANYARPGRESRHNTAYWLGRSYLGIGPGAHGMLDAVTAHATGLLPLGVEAARVRYAEPRPLDGWLTGAPEVLETLTADEVAREDVMLGLRLVRGVSARAVSSAGLDCVLAGLQADGLVELAEEGRRPRWRTTRRGWLLGNEVFRRVWVEG